MSTTAIILTVIGVLIGLTGIGVAVFIVLSVRAMRASD